MADIVPIIVFGFDYDKARRNAGPGTYQRCQGARRLFEKLEAVGKYPLVIVSPGRAPGVSAADQSKTMAEMMRNALADCGVPFQKIILAGTGSTWETRPELISAIVQIERWLHYRYRVEEAYLVSNRLHLWRIWILAEQYKKIMGFPLHWRFFACEWDLPAWNTRERAKELSKFLVELFYALPVLSSLVRCK